MQLPSLWLLTDALRLPDPSVLVPDLPAGTAVLLRHRDRATRSRLGRSVAALCRGRRLPFLIADDWRLAAQIPASGLHLPERAARIGRSAAALLWRRRTRRLLTVAAHDRAGLVRAARLKADAVLLAPIFATASHPGGRTVGPLRLASLARTCRVPVIALGGLSIRTAHRVRGSGAAGFAAIDAFRSA